MKRLILCLLLATALLFISIPNVIFAAVFNVNSTTDSADAAPGNGICADVSGNCTLRAAVQEANATEGSSTINLPAGTYTLSLPGGLEVFCNLTIVGAGASTTIIDGGAVARVFHVAAEGTLTANDLTVRNGDASGGFGGGFRNQGSLSLHRVAVTANTAGAGGGIYNTGTLIISESLINGNSATDVSGGWCFGGGVYVWTGTASLTNVTISTNTANCPGGGTGAGIILQEGSSTYFRNCTIAYNVGPSYASGHGVMGNGASGHAFLNTIVANNTGSDCYQIGSLSPWYIGSDPTGYNIGSDGSCYFGSTSSIDPLLGLLQDNGGPTWTHSLLSGSPAIDAGTTDNAPTIDQRGFGRPAGSGIDIGAFEFIPAPTIAKAFLPTTIRQNETSTLTFTISNSNTFDLTGVAFTDNFPAGLVVATPPNVVNNCGGIFTAGAGNSSVSLSDGTLSASSNCTISVSVLATTLGVKNNTTGAVSSTNAGTGTTSNTAALAVTDPYDLCLKDNLTGNLFEVSTTTWSYKFTQCSPWATLTGTGVMTPIDQCAFMLLDVSSGHFMKANANKCTRSGNAGVVSPGLFFNLMISSPNAIVPCVCSKR